ncbi:MAG TPA: hypothetical protein DCL77_04815 [Prolixibacteraceae bacterium]|jgi:hypothetical protein|nr:hypothetical protein [Prolixibacteraceae bacterium]
MTSEHTKNDHENLLKGLLSADQEKVIETLEELRVSGEPSDIPVLLEMLHISKDKEIKVKIHSLFANLKDVQTIPLIIAAIQNERYAPELQQLVSCCWENGLDYTPYLPLFVDLLIEKDFLVAFEAYTVITNMVTTIDQVKIDVEIEKLDKALHTTTEEKKVLMLDVVDFLPSIGY